MRHHPARRATARLGVVLTAAALAAGTAAAAASATAASPAAAQGAAAHTVLLVNGDRLMLGAPGAPAAVRVLPGAASALAGALVALGPAASGLVIPRMALPYLGRGLDPALFRPGSLQAAETGGRLPVTVAYRGKLPSLPGVHLTGGSGGVARGYLTAAGRPDVRRCAGRAVPGRPHQGQLRAGRPVRRRRVGEPGRIAGRRRAGGAVRARPGVPHAHADGHRHQHLRPAGHR